MLLRAHCAGKKRLLSSPDPIPPPVSTARSTPKGLLFALLLGGALRLAHAAGVSLHLDDFHSLYHARNLAAGSFWVELLADNHPPLSFLILGGFRALGEDPFLLRVPNVLFGLATIYLTWRTARFLPGRHTADVAALAVALSSLHIELTSDLRMYGLLALATVGIVHGLMRIVHGGVGVRAVGIWSWIGLHTHYHFVHVLALLGPLSLWLVWRSRGVDRGRLRSLVISYACAVALSLPWYIGGFPQQLSHGLAPGGSSVSLLGVLEGLAHLLFFRVSLAPTPIHEALVGAASVSLLLGGAGFAWLAFGKREAGEARSLAYVLAVPAFVLPVWTALIALLLPRAGFEWRYLAGAIAPFGILVALVHRHALGRIVVSLVLVAAGLNAVFVVLAPGREDYLGAVRTILLERSADDPVLAADWQPRLFPHGVGWNFYAPRLHDTPVPQIRHTDEFRLAPETRLEDFQRVHCILRSIPNHMPMLETLREEFPHEQGRAFGQSVFLLTFERSETN